MHVPLTDAPFGKPLFLVKVTNSDLALRLRRMGLFEGSELLRLNEDVLVQPVRVRGPKGDAILGGGMGFKIVVHMDDGRKLPLVEMKPGETGHIEGLIGGNKLADALDTLGLNINDRICLVRKLPPMEYVTMIEKKGRVRLTEGMAAKIWGRMEENLLQFVLARKGKRFYVQKILAGANARMMLASQGIEPGKVLILEGVEQAKSLYMSRRNPVVVSSRNGLRLYLQQKDAKRIFVREVGAVPSREFEVS